jgi:hypothetical protein
MSLMAQCRAQATKTNWSLCENSPADVEAAFRRAYVVVGVTID